MFVKLLVDKNKPNDYKSIVSSFLPLGQSLRGFISVSYPIHCTLIVFHYKLLFI